MVFLRRPYLFYNPYFYLNVWLTIFALVFIIILLVQLFILPYVFPHMHAGDGLLIGGDWLGFHRAALEMAERINSEGWTAWELRPYGWLPAGIAGALYALTVPAPWVLAPLNAAIHATTAVLVIKVLLLFTDDRKRAFFAALPFIFFPSAMLWYTQIHREGYSILGMLLFIYGLLLIVRLDKEKASGWLVEGIGFLYTLLGVVVIWMVRPHQVVIYQYMFATILLIIAVAMIIYLAKKHIQWNRVFRELIFLGLLVVIIYPFTLDEEAAKYQAPAKCLDVNDCYEDELISCEDVCKIEWESTPWLPAPIDNQLYSLSFLRSVSYQERYGKTASGIDYDITLRCVFDYVTYLPRAMQIAFLAPFPSEWFAEGTDAATTVFRRISAFEMSFVYLMLAPLIYSLWLWRHKLELYILVFFCTAMMMPIVYGIPNVGTIYRYRYGFLMLLVSLALLSLLSLIRTRRKNRAETKSGAGTVNNSSGD